MVYFFYENGTGIAGGIFPFIYSVKDGIITITMESNGKSVTASASYDINDDLLSAENSDGVWAMERTEIPEELKK